MKASISLSLVLLLAFCQMSYSNIPKYGNDTTKAYQVYFKADQMPKPAGCPHALSDELSDKFGITTDYKNGKVKIQFTVNTEGNIENVYLNKSNYPEMSQKVIDIFSNLKTPWEPGLYCGEKVNVSMTSTIIFKNGWMKVKINDKTLL